MIEVSHGDIRYLTFSSWYVELILRFRGDELEIDIDKDKQLTYIQELMPTIRAVNWHAYDVVNDIENQIRNFVVLKAHDMVETQGHFLNFKVRVGKRKQNIHKKAINWRTDSIAKSINADLNPLVAYCSTRELAATVDLLASRLKSGAWKAIADSLRSVADIRDAVMHNQLITEHELLKLETLQNEIYSALNE
ncbi:MAG: hypothetical protein KDD78_07070 [Caldilineaceae bacterium]|nr:hypothetical protein [Caldilineaceae bacterium]